MVYLKKILIFNILLILLVCCKTSDGTKNSTDSNKKQLNDSNTKNELNEKKTKGKETSSKDEKKPIFEIHCQSELYLKLDMIKTIKFNNKIVLFDLSNDINELIKTKKYDSTDDVLTSNNYIYGEEKLKLLNEYKDIFQKSLIDDSNEFKKDCYVNLKLLPYENNLDDNANIISIMIEEYEEGEYNLIKNKPTKIKIDVNLNKNDSQNKILLFVKEFKQNSSINCPTESLRIKNIAQNTILEIFNILKKNYINKSVY